MGRHRAVHLKYAHYELETWASWIHTHQGENGVMGSQVMNWSGIVPDTPPHALVPRVDMPRPISWVDLAYTDAPDDHRRNIEIKYLENGKVPRHSEDRMLEYIAGALLLLKRLSS